MLEILERITEGKGEINDLETLKDIATGMQKMSLCALGQTAASPTLSTIRHFKEEYEAHIIEKRCPAGVCAALFKTTCRNACPINQDIPVYMALASKGKFEEAYKVIKQTNPLPLVLGRVCHHPCEEKCDRRKFDEPLAIREVKRFVADYAYENNFEYRPPKRAERKEKIAIVGSGPAGLAAGLAHAARDARQVQRFPDLAFPFLVLVDRMTGAGGELLVKSGLVVADRAYVPIQASQFDVWTLDQMDSLVNQAQGLNPDLEAYVVINRASTNPMVEESNEARKMLDEFDSLVLLESIIRDRIAYRKAARDGMAVFELPKLDHKACAEINSLYQEIYG